MPIDTRWGYYTPRLWAEVAGVTLDVGSVRVDYTLSGLPRCLLQIAIGRNVATGDVSAIHALVPALAMPQPVNVWCNLLPADASDPTVQALGVPGGPFILFAGYTAGTGYMKSSGSGKASYQLACNHWLSLLTEASAVSDSSHPANPSHFSYGHMHPLTTGDGAGAGPGYPTVLGQANKVITSANLSSDVWGSALYPWLKAIAATDRLEVAVGGTTVKGTGTRPEVLDALKRLAPGGVGYQPLSPRDKIMVDTDIAGLIAQDVVAGTRDPAPLANQTLWDVLVGHFAADYGFAIVPRPLDALVVPFVPAFRGQSNSSAPLFPASPYAVIPAVQQAHVELHTGVRRPLRAYGLLAALDSRSGAGGTPKGGPTGTLGFGGWYEGRTDGSVRITGAPRWLSSNMKPSFNTRKTRTSSSHHPRSVASTGAIKKAEERAKKMKTLLDSFAHMRFVQESLQERWGVVNGPLRFDIAPGSTIGVEGSPELALGDADSLGQGFYGTLMAMSFGIDAESPAAYTSIHLGFVRTAAENAMEQFSVPEHPLYTKVFAGAPLIV